MTYIVFGGTLNPTLLLDCKLAASSHAEAGFYIYIVRVDGAKQQQSQTNFLVLIPYQC